MQPSRARDSNRGDSRPPVRRPVSWHGCEEERREGAAAGTHSPSPQWGKPGSAARNRPALSRRPAAQNQRRQADKTDRPGSRPAGHTASRKNRCRDGTLPGADRDSDVTRSSRNRDGPKPGRGGTTRSGRSRLLARPNAMTLGVADCNRRAAAAGCTAATGHRASAWKKARILQTGRAPRGRVPGDGPGEGGRYRPVGGPKGATWRARKVRSTIYSRVSRSSAWSGWAKAQPTT